MPKGSLQLQTCMIEWDSPRLRDHRVQNLVEVRCAMPTKPPLSRCGSRHPPEQTNKIPGTVRRNASIACQRVTGSCRSSLRDQKILIACRKLIMRVDNARSPTPVRPEYRLSVKRHPCHPQHVSDLVREQFSAIIYQDPATIVIQADALRHPSGPQPSRPGAKRARARLALASISAEKPEPDSVTKAAPRPTSPRVRTPTALARASRLMPTRPPMTPRRRDASKGQPS